MWPLPSLRFFFNDTATTEIYTLSLHDALPIWEKIRDYTRSIPASWRPILLEKFKHRCAHCKTSLKGLEDRKSSRLNSSHSQISYAVFCLKKKKTPAGTAPGADVVYYDSYYVLS